MDDDFILGGKISGIVVDDAQPVTSFVSVGEEVTKITTQLDRAGSIWFIVHVGDRAVRLINSKYVVEVYYAE